ncbi:hypothetical protein PM082_014070 [Marasmius tenuissimus]|nr:hypothetical protein PM082_014070 [Marasmius tenuissimus]
MERSAMDLPNPFDTLSGRAIITTLHSLAILLTIYRLFRRIRINRFWGDDWLAALALFLMGFYVAGDWIRYSKMKSNGHNESSDNSQYGVVLLRINMSLSHAIVWCCRASHALSVSRILPPGRRRTMSIVLAIFCLVAGSLYAILVQTLCTLNTTWTQGAPKGTRYVKCKGRGALTIAAGTSDVLSNVFLVALPLHCLWRVSDLPPKERRLIMVLFASTILTLIPSVVRAVYAYEQSPFAVTYTMKFQVATSLMFCNLVVVATRIYQILFRRRESEPSTGTELSSPHPTIILSSATHDTQIHSNDRHRRHMATSTSAKSDLVELTRISDMYSLRTNATSHNTHITQIEPAHLRATRIVSSSSTCTSKGQG